MTKLTTLFFKFTLACLAVVLAVTFVANTYVIASTNAVIYDIAELVDGDYDCIMVLGAGVRGGRPSPILNDRLARGYQLYQQGYAPKLLLSGDHHTENYDEIAAMQAYMRNAGVPDCDIFMDHAGLSTYESMMRASQVFGVRKMIVVTQQFHINRALYLAKQAGIDAVGVSAAKIAYRGATYRAMREVLARTKDFFIGIIKPKMYIGGPSIDIHGDGSVSDD